MKIVFFLVSLISTVILIGWFFMASLRRENLGVMNFFRSAFSENRGPARPLALAMYVWAVFFVLAMGMLLFVGFMCLFYSIALFHGEVILMPEALGISAGNLVIHLIYPVEVFLFALFTLVLFIGATQIFYGPIAPLSKLALKVEGVVDLCRKLLSLLAVILMLELVKTSVYSLLSKPEALTAFFAEGIDPMMRPVPFALMAGSSVLISAGALKILRRG